MFTTFLFYALSTVLLAAAVGSITILSFALACDKVPLLAPTGSVINLFASSSTIPLNSEIEIIVERDERILLTRDRELLKRRSIKRGCYIRALRSTQQLYEIFDRLDLARNARPFTLCLTCNAPLRAVAKAEVLMRLPPGPVAFMAGSTLTA